MKIGFLGCGQMGGALARAVRRADPAAVILLVDADTKKRCVLYFEPNEKAIKIIKYYNMSALAK